MKPEKVGLPPPALSVGFCVGRSVVFPLVTIPGLGVGCKGLVSLDVFCVVPAVGCFVDGGVVLKNSEDKMI